MKSYITTTLPYVNAEPHIGFALEIVQADILARWAELEGKKVFFNTGTDEHGTKIYRKAEEEGRDVQDYVDEYAEKFKSLKDPHPLQEKEELLKGRDTHHFRTGNDFRRLTNLALN